MIIDCGANVELSPACLLTRFPDANVIAIEPDPENFLILQENMRPYASRVLLMQTGIWSRSCSLCLVKEGFRDGNHWSRQVREAESGETDCMTATDVGTILNQSGAASIGVLKMDIERAELEVFKDGCPEWLKQCENIVMELHDAECEAVFTRAVKDLPFDISKHGELTVCKRIVHPGINLRYSIVIVSYHRHEALCNTLRAINTLIDPELGEIIVVDQCPINSIPEDIRAMNGLRYHVLHRAGMVLSRNVGIEKARGEVIIFLDDDIIPHADLMIGHLSSYSDPKVGGVAGRILDYDGMADSGPHPKVFDPVEGWCYAHFEHSIAGDVMTARGCNMSFRRDLLVKLGGFDGHLAIFRDDTDMCFRVIEAGYVIRFVPEASLVHLSAPTGGTRSPTTTAESGYWRREWRSYRQHHRHYRDNLYFLFRHFHGTKLRKYIVGAYRDYVGLSRWPWRLIAKNMCFLLAIAQGWMNTRAGKKPIVNSKEHSTP